MFLVWDKFGYVVFGKSSINLGKARGIVGLTKKINT